MNEVNKKRRNASRVISLIVAVALMFIVSACNGEEAAVGSTSEETQTVETTEQETSTDAAVEPEAGPFDEFMEIEWLGFNMRAGLEEGTEIELFFEEKYNVDFVWPDLVDWSSSEKISVSIAAGELPEFCAVLRSDEFDLYDQGLTRSIPNKMIREFAPNYAAILEDEGGWLLQKVADADESICMYEYYKRECNNVASYYRYDWMKDLGIEANGEVVESLVDGVYYCAEPFTLNQMVDILQQFVESDINGIESEATVGMANVHSAIFSCFGVPAFGSTIANIEENGQTIPWWAPERLIDAYQFLIACMSPGY